MSQWPSIDKPVVRRRRERSHDDLVATGIPSRADVSSKMATRATKMKIAIGGTVIVVVIAAIILAVTGKDVALEEEERKGHEYMQRLDKENLLRRNRGALAEWAYDSNITAENEQLKLKVSSENARLAKEAWKETITFNWRDFHDKNLKRQFELYSILGDAALPQEKYDALERAVVEMSTNYATAKICDFKNNSKCDLSLEPEITEIFEKSQDPDLLKHTWVEWYNKAGRPSKNAFIKYVELSNEAAKKNNYTDQANAWLDTYEQKDFEQQMGKIWNQLKPLYLQIHAYVRKQLFNKYGPSLIDRKGPIPSHLLGNVWAQSWSNLESFTRPYPEKQDLNITPVMLKKNYTALKIFQMADEFFQSLNLTAMPPKFWQNSILTKPEDGRELVCHASAWDFYDGEDFRIKQCTVVNQQDFETAHHEMGHIQYYLQYKHQPAIYRDGANPGFHEAIGDVIALSATSPKHLRKIGLLEELSDDAHSEINQLFHKGMEKIVFLPFAFLLDLYRYGIFRGEITPDNYNCHFWKLKEEYQGVEPPVNRTEEDFDAAAKYHISADVEYARYYVSFIIQFQFHRALCEKAGEYVPGNENKKLTDCDIYQSVSAGNALGDMLKLGSSRPWPDAMELLTGQRDMDSNGILEYFKPLQTWLEEENTKTGEFIGWEKSKIGFCTATQLAEIEAMEQLRKQKSKKD